MSETSISLSPSKSDGTIYTTRLKRGKRFKNDLSVQINSHQETKTDFLRKLLADFYKDKEDVPTGAAAPYNKSKFLLENPSILKNFKPFELEKSLVMADNIFVQQFSTIKANPFTETQGFVNCTSLSQANNSPQGCSIIETERNNQNTSFIITETELISLCHQAEQVVKNNDFSEQDRSLHESTPEKNDNMALVNSILEDFSQSPLRKEQIVKNCFWQHTPEFRLRRLPVKSYSSNHRKSARINFTQDLPRIDTVQSPECDDNASYYSSFSVQEDDTFCENPNSQSTATPLNNAERLCENLLNLTEYFTQNELNESLEGDHQSEDDLYSSRKSNDFLLSLHKISDLLDNIFTLRTKYTNKQSNDSYESTDDFYGFSNSDHKIDNDIVEQNAITANLNLAPDFNLRHIRHSNKEDNNLLDDWSEDDCHDIFACIDTENVLQQNNINIPYNKSNNIDKNQNFIASNLPILNSTLGNCIAFETASLKTTEVLKEMATKTLSSFADIPDFSEKDPIPNCDKALLKDENIFKNPEDYEWNDDCDLFLNFQTPIIQQEAQTLPELSQHAQNAPSTSKLARLGFTTAAGKKVRITSKGQAVIQKLRNEFAGEINNNKSYEEELKEIKFKVYAKTHNLKTEPSTLSVKNHFNKNQYLQNAQFAISTEQNSKNYINEFYADSEQIFEKSFEVTIFENTPPATQIQTFNLESKPNEISTKTQNMKKLVEVSVDMPVQEFLADSESIENVLNTEGDQQNNLDTKNSVLLGKHNMKTHHLSVGFQTANGKQVSISTEAKRRAEALLKEFNTDVDVEKDLKDIKSKVQLKDKDLKPKSNHTVKNDEDLAKPVLFNQCKIQGNQLNPNICKGFQTANGKEICISTKAKKTVESLLKEFSNDLEPFDAETSEKYLKIKIPDKNKGNRPKILNLKYDEDIVRQNLNLNANTNVGFQTANGKHVAISEKAKQVVGNFFKDFNTAANFDSYEEYLKDVKIEIRSQNQDLQAKSISQIHKETPSTIHLGGNSSPKLANSKRKISTDNSDLEISNKTPAAKIFKNDLQTSKSSLAVQSLKSPLTSVTRPIIVRKNLLSLTKKRKNRGNMLDKPTEEISKINNDLNVCTATPAKSVVSMKSEQSALETPDLKEFLSKASLTSTPRINTPQNSSYNFDDSDFKPIIWKNDYSTCNISQSKSIYARKLSECSTSNISFNSPNPTAKERIGRLKIYGKAPDVSPILIETNHNCRPSGLRRGRSMLKKTEN